MDPSYHKVKDVESKLVEMEFNGTRRKITWFYESPGPGPECTCSFCGKPILRDPVIRVCSDNPELKAFEARFHYPCLFAKTEANHE